MYLRVAVDLGRRGEEEAGALLLRQPQRVPGADRPDLEGLDGQLEIVDRRGGGGEVQDEIHWAGHMDEMRDVAPEELEAGLGQEVGDVVRGAGEKAVEAHHLVAPPQEGLAEVAAEETAATRHHHPALGPVRAWAAHGLALPALARR
jgi:hypothetical protein